MTTYTRPRSIPARCARRGDEVAFVPGSDGGPLTDPDDARDERVQWFRITGIRAGSSIEPMAVEFGGYDHEFDLDEPIVVREVTDSNVDPQTGQPWGVDEDGFDHSRPHAPNDWCREPCGDDGCGLCRGYNCGPFATSEVRGGHR